MVLIPIGINGCVALNIQRDPFHDSVEDSVYTALPPMAEDSPYAVTFNRKSGDLAMPLMDALNQQIRSPHTGKMVKIRDLPDPSDPFAGFRAWMCGWQDSPFSPVEY